MQWRLVISPLIVSHCKDENSFWNGKGKEEKKSFFYQHSSQYPTVIIVL